MEFSRSPFTTDTKLLKMPVEIVRLSVFGVKCQKHKIMPCRNRAIIYEKWASSTLGRLDKLHVGRLYIG